MPVTREKPQLMSASEIDRTLVRLAHEILERTEDLDKLAFIGIRRRGVPLAQRLVGQKIEALEQRKIPVGILDINLYRDDLSTVSHAPVLNSTDIPFPVTGKDIILMDDVLYTGRTIRAALDALFDHGRPARVQLLVLIDRGHRELPIEAQLRRPHGADHRQRNHRSEVPGNRRHGEGSAGGEGSTEQGVVNAMPAGLLGIEDLTREEVQAILDRAAIFSRASRSSGSWICCADAWS